MSVQGTNLDAPPFFGRMAAVKVVHLSVLAATYGLALAFFPAISRGVKTHAYFSETYLGSIAASAILSILALLTVVFGVLVNALAAFGFEKYRS
jgi:cytosine/uracil/thiamine/allantoin permease